nr:MAG TPA: hypothetical protein [Caudoviricetes sp.]
MSLTVVVIVLSSLSWLGGLSFPPMSQSCSLAHRGSTSTAVTYCTKLCGCMVLTAQGVCGICARTYLYMLRTRPGAHDKIMTTENLYERRCKIGRFRHRICCVGNEILVHHRRLRGHRIRPGQPLDLLLEQQ